MKNFIEKHSSKTVPTISYMIMQAFKDMFEQTHQLNSLIFLMSGSNKKLFRTFKLQAK